MNSIKSWLRYWRGLFVAPALAVSFMPVTIAAPSLSQASAAEGPIHLAQMEQMSCEVVPPEYMTEIFLFAAPDYQSETVGLVSMGEWVAFNIGDRSGMWAEVTDGEGETGWIETSYLYCNG